MTQNAFVRNAEKGARRGHEAGEGGIVIVKVRIAPMRITWSANRDEAARRGKARWAVVIKHHAGHISYVAVAGI